MTHGADTEHQQDTQAAPSSSTVHTPMTDIGDTDQLGTGNVEFENLGESTPAKRIRLKSRLLVQTKRPRETLTDLEHMESEELKRMETGSSANKRKNDQPEGTTAKEQRVDDIAMDEGQQDASMKMVEMRMDQVMVVSCGISRVCEPRKVRTSDN